MERRGGHPAEATTTTSPSSSSSASAADVAPRLRGSEGGGVPGIVTVLADPTNGTGGGNPHEEGNSNLDDDDDELLGGDAPSKVVEATKIGGGDERMWEMDLDSYQIKASGVLVPPRAAGASAADDGGTARRGSKRCGGSELQGDEELPSPSSEPSPPTSTIGDTFRFVFGCGRSVTLLFVVGAVGAALNGLVYPALAYVLSHTFTSLSSASSNGLEALNRVAYSFVAVGSFALVTGLAQNWAMELVAYHASLNYRKQYVRALLRQDHAFFDVYDVGGIASQVEANANRYRRGVGRKFAEGIESAVAAAGGLVYALNSSWRVALVTLAFVPLFSLTARFMMRLNEARGAVTASSYQRAGGLAYSAVSAVRTVLSSNGVKHMTNAYAEATLEALREGAKFSTKLGLATGSMMGSFLLLYCVLTLYGTSLLYNDVRGTGCDPSAGVPGAQDCPNTGTAVFGAMIGVAFAARGMSQVGNVVEVFSQARVATQEALLAMRRVPGSPRRVLYKDENDEGDSDIPDVVNEPMCHKDIEMGGGRLITVKKILPTFCIDSASRDGLKPNIGGRIKFQNVSFHYPTRPTEAALDGLSFDVAAGETVALVGPSGGGKSSIVLLLERFYDPTAGRILLDGVDLKEYNVQHLRSSLGYVGQEPVLFATTVRENILFGKPNASQEEVEEAARLAHAHDFIVSLPDGYDTHVGDAGSMISVGQKQRICLARVLVADHKILLLDEATSALDAESELMVQSALDSVLHRRKISTIVIAHRLSTIRNASRINVVVHGRVEESGTHEELMASNTYYRRLVEKQEGLDGREESSPSGLLPSDRLLVGDNLECPLLPVPSNMSVPHVEFRNVSFSYPSRPNKVVLRDFNLTLHRGETVALVGPSGGGKSTTASLVERFYDVSSGYVLYGGYDVRSLNVEWYRKQLSYVEQEPTLFNMTIAENIAFGSDGVSLPEIEAAAVQANAHDFIMESPEGYATLVGTSKTSTGLSGGQKQRVAIARALARKPRVLILDEATSALDNESETKIQQAIHNLMHSREHTVLVIAHRLSTIRNADRIALIADGKVLECGSHEELMSLPEGRYKRLLNSSKRRSTLFSVGLKSIAEDAKTDDTEEEVNWEEVMAEEEAKAFSASRARKMAIPDSRFLLIGAVGALIAGCVFPMWGIVYSQTIGLLFTPVVQCPLSDGVVPPPYSSCEAYWSATADSMQRRSYVVAGYWGGLVVACIVGNVVQFYGFGMASDRLNKRIRDMSFLALLRQEVAFFDKRGVGSLLAQLQDDAARIHAFSGEPVRTLVTALSSALIGIVIAFAFMWPFALATIGCVPILTFGSSMRMKRMLGEDYKKKKTDEPDDFDSPTGSVLETLSNMRTVSALVLEDKRFQLYESALDRAEPNYRMNAFSTGATAALALSLVQWAYALLFWLGGWLMIYKGYSFNSFLIASFGILFSFVGLGSAFSGLSDRAQVEKSAGRVLYLLDRISAIDPLSDAGEVLELEK